MRIVSPASGSGGEVKRKGFEPMWQQTMKIKGVTVVSATTPAGTTLDRQRIINSEAASTVEPSGFPSSASNCFQVIDSGYFAELSLCFHDFATGFFGKSGLNHHGLKTLRKNKAGGIPASEPFRSKRGRTVAGDLGFNASAGYPDRHAQQ